MAPKQTGQFRQLPLIPKSLLRKHRVLETFDTRFRACARLLQAMWREEQKLPIGIHDAPDGRQRRIGSLISATAATAGRNFLSAEVAHLAAYEMAYQERGAFIDQRRLFSNLLSSMPLAFNLFAPLRLDLDLAARVIRSLIPDIDLARVLELKFEHSPGRDLTELTGDRTAFDVAIVYERADGETGLIAIEQKYSEGHDCAAGDLGPRFNALAVSSELYKAPMSAVLRTGPCQQLFREHLLVYGALHRRDYAEATFMLVAPRHNHLIQQGASLYASHLFEPGRGGIPFLNVELERVIEAIAWCGEFDYAQALYDRYCNFIKVDLAVEETLRATAKSWVLVPRAKPQALGLLSKAA